MTPYRETGKDRWRRIPKDYFRKPDGFQRTKFLVSCLALILTVGWVVLGVNWNNPRDYKSNDVNSLRANHGELARVHAAWDQKCDACHVPFEPIDGRPLFSSTSTASSRTSDKLCMTCHAGPTHHATVMDSEVQSCAGCHRDHRGRETSLVRLEDNTCTGCHQALDRHSNPDAKVDGTRVYAKTITKFSVEGHAGFRSEFTDNSNPAGPVDRSRLKFNHALHMNPGVVAKLGDVPHKVSWIPVSSERERYGKGLDQAIQLDCSSCHVLDSGDASVARRPKGPVTALTSRSPGEVFLPVNFQNQCRACHPLTIEAGASTLEAPHGVQPDEVVQFLRQTYASQILKESPDLLEAFLPGTPLPGKRPREESARKLLDAKVATAEKLLFDSRNNCGECHYSQGVDHGVVPKAIEPTRVPDVWFSHALFNHSAHRGVSCRDCHARAYAIEADGKTPVKNPSTVHTDVLLPAIDNCVQCHAPSQSRDYWFSGANVTTGGVSASCVECHKYHNGDHPLQGKGALAQGATRERTVAEFLGGPGQVVKPVADKTKPPAP